MAHLKLNPKRRNWFIYSLVVIGADGMENGIVNIPILMGFGLKFMKLWTSFILRVIGLRGLLLLTVIRS
jgi:hypothetical protein